MSASGGAPSPAELGLAAAAPGLGSRRAILFLLIILLAGFVLRLTWWLTETPVISLEGAEYVRMAENLFAGHGLVGNFEGPETMYTPLLPVLTAAAMVLVHDGRLAGQLVALAFGIALIPVAYFLARLLYGTRVALIAAALVAAHPVLVKLSGSIYTESVYVTFFLAAIFFGLRALELRRLVDAALTGGLFGLAYLTRPEAFAYPLFFAFVFCACGFVRKSWRRGAAAAFLTLAIFALLAAPYVAYLDVETGSPRLEGKWNINYTMAQNFRAGMSDFEGRYGVKPDLTLEGPLLAPYRFAAFTPYPHGTMDKLKTLLFMAKRQKDGVYDNLVSPSLGSPLLLVLVVIALFRGAWSNRRLAQESILLVMALSILVLMLTGPGLMFRFLFPLVPLFLIWAAKGLDEFRDWVRGAETAGPSRRAFMPRPAAVAAALQLGVAATMIGFSAWSSRTEFEFAIEQSSAAMAERDAGLWLAQRHPETKRIATRFVMLPYYARGTLINLPYADETTTLRYIAQKQIDYVVVENVFARSFPVIQQWLARGIPDPHAHRIYDHADAAGDRVAIYAWARDGA